MPDAGNLAEMSDGELVRQARAGSLDAFDALVTRYRKRIYRLAFAMTQSHDAADDLSQKAFVQAYTRLKQLRDADSFASWLRRILMNLCIRYASTQRPLPLGDDDERACGPDTAYASAERAMVRESVKSAILKLDPGERAVVLLYYIDDLKQTEIAEVLQCPVGTVWSRLSSARKKLRAHLADLVG